MKQLIKLLSIGMLVPAISYGQDMSGWSDKTVCRLLEQSGKTEFVKEADSRGLNCTAPIQIVVDKFVAHKDSRKIPITTYYSNFGEAYNYGSDYRTELPEYPNPTPNKATLQTYLEKYINEPRTFRGFKVSASDSPYQFAYKLKGDEYVKQHIQKTSLLSYLLYEDGAIVVDEITPESQFGTQVNNQTPLPSRSLGKTFTSYLLGHAICEGYIGGLDSRMNDWPKVEGTVYHDQKLIDLVNMRAGDQKYAHTNQVFLPEQIGVRHQSLLKHLASLKGSKPSKRFYNYNDLVVNTVTNYIDFKTGYQYQEFVSGFLRNKIGIGENVYFLSADRMSVSPSGIPSNGAYISNYSASRYDFLRIARSMLGDWQNDTCEGKYLKDIYKARMRKDIPDSNFQKALREHKFPNKSYNSYAGYFHTDLYKVPKTRSIMAMDGFGGQMIVIDFDFGRIVVTNSIYSDYNWKKIVRDVIANQKP